MIKAGSKVIEAIKPEHLGLRDNGRFVFGRRGVLLEDAKFGGNFMVMVKLDTGEIVKINRLNLCYDYGFKHKSY